MATFAKVKVQDLRPGMRIERIDANLDFVYREVEMVEPRQINGRTKSYLVTPVNPTGDPDSSYRPFTARLTERLTVLQEEDERPILTPGARVHATMVTRLTGMERLLNSRNGNPRWRLRVPNGDSYDTKVDAAVGHKISEGFLDKTVTLLLDDKRQVIGVAGP